MSGRIGRLLWEGAVRAEFVVFLGEAEHNMSLADNTALDELVVSEILEWYTKATREG
jgi:hypothetical protein